MENDHNQHTTSLEIEALNALLERIPSISLFTEFWQGCEGVFIYGAGNFGKDVFWALTKRGISVFGFLDQKACPGQHWNGVPVLQPDDQSIAMPERNRGMVIIAIHNRETDIPQIMKRLRSLHYGRLVTQVELYDYLGTELGDRFWLSSRRSYQSSKPSIISAFGLWADETSKSLYTAILHSRFTGDYSVLPAPDTANQYFPLDIPPWQSPLRLVDCGAYVGDTLARFLEAGISIESVAAFEPDRKTSRSWCVLPKQTAKAYGTWYLCPVVCIRPALSSASLQATVKAACLLPQAMPWCNVYPWMIASRRSRQISLRWILKEQSMRLCLGHGRSSPGTSRPWPFRSITDPSISGKYLCSSITSQWSGRDIIGSFCACTRSADLNWSCMPLPADNYAFFLRSHGFSGFDVVLYAIPRKFNRGK